LENSVYRLSWALIEGGAILGFAFVDYLLELSYKFNGHVALHIVSITQTFTHIRDGTLSLSLTF